MQLEHIVVRMRSRTGWEAMDLGFALVRNAARDIFRAQAVAMLPLFVIAVIVGHFFEGAGWVVLWWSKPVLNAVTLSVLGRSLIGERVGIREVFLVAPRALQAHLVGALTWRRLSPSRTFTMPVRHLEGLRGKAARDRIATLTTTHRGSAQLACFAGAWFEGGLIFAGLQALAMLAPTSTVVRTSFWLSAPSDWLVLGVTALAFMIVEPVFAGIGFALYINRRVDLEGWDLELAFRSLRARIGKRAVAVASMVACALLFLPCVALAEPPAVDEQPEASFIGPPPPPARAIKEILSSKDFDNWDEVMTWQRSDADEEKDEETEEPSEFNPAPFIGIGAVIAEMVPWILGALGVVLLVHLTIALLRGRVAKGAKLPHAPVVDEEWAPKVTIALPEDVAAFARAAFARGEAALALSILYRGAIDVLRREADIDFPEGATEQECMTIVRGRDVPPDLRDAFEVIARTWQRCAYAHMLPNAETAQALCDRYASVIAPFKRTPPSEVAA